MKKILVLGILTILFSACSDFIDEDNRSNETAESFYTTASGFETLVNANYAQLKEIYGGDAYVFCAGTDLYAVGSGRGSEPDGLSQYTQLNSSSVDVDQLYTSCYRAINSANTALYYSDLTEKTINLNQLVGEIKYLRANAYFLLVQTYGGVGILKDFLDSPVLSFNRDSAEDVYKLIITDLEESLNAVTSGSYVGRVNKKAVQHLLAKVHLTRAYESFADANDFATAASYADEAIAGQSLTIPFDELWKPGNELNNETVFSVQYSTASASTDPENLGHKQANWYGPYLGGSENAGNAGWRSYTLLATDFALSLFTEEDERYKATFMTEAFMRYYDAFDVDDTSGLEVRHYYAPQWATPADITAYALEHPEAQIHEWGTYAAGVVSSDYQTIPAKKFDDPKAPFQDDSRVSTRDIILSRLGETYLIAAEAYLNTNKATGLARLNAVRNRAGLTTPLADYDIDIVLDERARELFGEYHRWFDLKRTGKLVERASMYNYLVDAANFNGANGELKILRPIPQSALDLNQNKDFPQNAAYQ
ncbi:RagB/SusD family nutrient uptake outer membrane protein [Polaribacter reichenbachii]|uniref:Carbohydrate-binding protein SusD n=1 Tax=Polaribacter reichenbachii TaxID=996801 RepID=A0A1B8TVG8_9FLAO|nr:RagB/SusD family nutrient uptake outer membrane protein [Polaribacter reichenbachii]APZ45411.1 RagB/SusD family nutrient uptake outer membrane protein [Polaribacter reichenbachii]AUC19272.1 RagB/SusD family nutrient uptake outer membrane protein [Polaribacter reichenbachii]OBY63572.1 carbohydrate-binding protein SusD [Polaribacter reichenbachii]